MPRPPESVPSRILALGAHPDDIELGCGGSLVKFAQQGSELHAAVFSQCKDEDTPESRTRATEYRAASAIIGLKEPLLFDFPNRELPEHRHEIMAVMEKLQGQLRPDLVFIPFLEDPHQDHETVARAAIRTFRRRETVLQFEILRYGSHSFTPSLFIDISDSLNKKIEALGKYESQVKRRAYFDEESFRSLARTRGAQSGYDYAEGFVVYKMFW